MEKTMQLRYLVFVFIFALGVIPVCLAHYANLGVPTPGRRIENWPYDRLFASSELVVIATAISNEESPDRSNDNPWKVELLGVNTKFEVESVIKGKIGDRLTVRHFKVPKGVLLEDGPLHTAFRTGSQAIKLEHTKILRAQPEYLLFLKATSDDRYELVSGSVDSELAVREMQTGSPDF